MAAEHQKRNRYADSVHSQGGLFVPFAIESLGGWGPAAVDLVRSIVTHAVETTDIDKCTANGMFIHRIAIAVQRGNARLVNGSHQIALARAHAHP